MSIYIARIYYTKISMINQGIKNIPFIMSMITRFFRYFSSYDFIIIISLGILKCHTCM
jgi:hypothetical protein